MTNWNQSTTTASSSTISSGFATGTISNPYGANVHITDYGRYMSSNPFVEAAIYIKNKDKKPTLKELMKGLI
jgi:hypothetical protein